MPRKMIARKLSAVLTCLLGLFVELFAAPAPLARAQETPPATQPERNVQIYISALDKLGQPILDLKEGDIQVLEGKKEDRILSVKPASSEPLRAGVLIDVSGSERTTALIADPDALSAFVRSKLMPNDSVFVTAFADNTNTFVDDWTNSPALADDSVRHALAMRRQGGSAVYDAINWACEARLCRRDGVQMLFIISDMVDNCSWKTRTETIKAALRSNVPVYVLLLSQEGNRELQRGQQAAKEFAEETGGLLVKATSTEQFREGLSEMNRAFAARYIVEISPHSPSPHPGFYKVNVLCTRKDVYLLAPKSYFIEGKQR